MKQEIATNFADGTISITPDRPSFFWNERITGIIEVRLSKEFPSNTINVEFKGVEKLKLIPKNETKFLTKEKKRKYSEKTIFAYSPQTIHSNDMNVFPVGIHKYRFDVQINAKNRPTFNHSCKTNNDILEATVKYFLRVSLVNSKCTLNTKKEILVISSSYTDNYGTKAKKTFELKGFKSIFKTRLTSLEIDLKEKVFDLEKNNRIFINVDTAKSNSSPLNLKICLINFIRIRFNRAYVICRNCVWEESISNKLSKGTNYSDEIGFTILVPSSVTSLLYQTFSTSKISNLYCFRVSYDLEKSTGNSVPEQNSVVIPVQFIRESIPQQIFSNTCRRPINLAASAIEEIDFLFLDKKGPKDPSISSKADILSKIITRPQSETHDSGISMVKSATIEFLQPKFIHSELPSEMNYQTSNGFHMNNQNAYQTYQNNRISKSKSFLN